MPDFDWKRLRIVVKEGIPYLATSVIYLAKDNIEKVVLLFLLGSQQLGLYVVAATASGLHTPLSRSVNILILPRSGSLAAEQAAHDAARIFRVMVIVSAVLSAAMVGLLPWLMPLLFGAGFKDSVLPAMLLVAAQFFSAQGSIIDESLRAQSRPGIGMIAGLVSVTFFCGLALVLAPRLGLVGVSIAAICGQVTYCLMLAIYLQRSFKLSLVPSNRDFRFIRDNLRTAINRTKRRVIPA
jgi:O-antigen/teichoic acid export membrane protein